MPADQIAQIFQVIEGGVQVAAENIVQFPVDAAGAAAETALTGQGTTTLTQLGNGAAAEVSQLTVLEGGVSTATTSGLGILAMDVGAVGAAIAPALGILAGVGLYNLAPEFWTNVADRLTAAGQTIGGKVRGFLNSHTRQFGLSQTTIEIFKEALLEAGIFNDTYNPQPIETSLQVKYRKNTSGNYRTLTINTNNYNRIVNHFYSGRLFCSYNHDGQAIKTEVFYGVGNPDTGSIIPLNIPINIYMCKNNISTGLENCFIVCFITDTRLTYEWGLCFYSEPSGAYQYFVRSLSTPTPTYFEQFPNKIGYTYHTIPHTWVNNIAYFSGISDLEFDNYVSDIFSNESVYVPTVVLRGVTPSQYIQPDATLPGTQPFPQTYPEWHPWTPPAGVPWPSNLPSIYPIEVPDLKPNINQQQAQNPDPDPDPAPWLQFIMDNVVVPEPILDPEPIPVPDPDPDPQPEPEPLPDPAEEQVDPDPPNPNPNPPVPPLPIVPILPDMVPSNAMFTVYNPSLSQLNSFGAWLWDNSIIEQIRKMWQNPLDGIIAFMKVYANPTIGNTSNIQVGYLDSGVPAPIVTSQFTTIDCGSVQVNELKHNATDYSPYTSLHIYLPFIGIVELDSNEFMNGTISVVYHVDVYTGTCLAEVKATRTIDMPNATIIYTFSGNISQQLPLTSATFGGLISALVTTGVSIATGGTGGALISAAKMTAVGHSFTQELVHIGHSGSLTANAGIMGARTPYIIIERRQGYDANAYNELYGYPANKTVFLGNCSGFTRVKAGRLQSKASEEEKDEIMNLLKEGVIL